MMTRRQKRVAPAVLPVVVIPGTAKRAPKRKAKSTSGSAKGKRGKAGKTPAPGDQGTVHPSQLERVPLLSGDKATGQGSTSLADVAAVVSNAVVEVLKASGPISTFQQDQNFSKGQNSDLAASVQGSVAGVIQDIASEKCLVFSTLCF